MSDPLRFTKGLTLHQENGMFVVTRPEAAGGSPPYVFGMHVIPGYGKTRANGAPLYGPVDLLFGHSEVMSIAAEHQLAYAFVAVAVDQTGAAVEESPIVAVADIKPVGGTAFGAPTPVAPAWAQPKVSGGALYNDLDKPAAPVDLNKKGGSSADFYVENFKKALVNGVPVETLQVMFKPGGAVEHALWSLDGLNIAGSVNWKNGYITLTKSDAYYVPTRLDYGAQVNKPADKVDSLVNAAMKSLAPTFTVTPSVAVPPQPQINEAAFETVPQVVNNFSVPPKRPLTFLTD